MEAGTTPKRERRTIEIHAEERVTGDPGAGPGRRTTGRVGLGQRALSLSARTHIETTTSPAKPASHSMTTINRPAKTFMAPEGVTT